MTLHRSEEREESLDVVLFDPDACVMNSSLKSVSARVVGKGYPDLP
jgi:hypothetical protein